MRRIRTAIVGLAVATALLSCGGDDGIEGTYVHPEEGTLAVEGDGKASLDQSGEVTELTYEQDGDTITFAVEDERQEAERRDDDIVFPSGAFSGDAETVFTKQ
jgi:hypothetical protein